MLLEKEQSTQNWTSMKVLPPGDSGKLITRKEFSIFTEVDTPENVCGSVELIFKNI